MSSPNLLQPSRLREVRVFSRQDACQLAPLKDVLVISVYDPEDGPAPLRRGWLNVLRLEFADIERREPDAILFDNSHARAILDALETHWMGMHSLFVHCRAGVSRSAAIGRFTARIAGVELPPHTDYFNRHVYSTLEENFIRRLTSLGVHKRQIRSLLRLS